VRQEKDQEMDQNPPLENPPAEGKYEDEERDQRMPQSIEKIEKADHKEEGQEIAKLNMEQNLKENPIEEAHPAEQQVEASVEKIKDSDEQQEQAQANSPESGLVGEELTEGKFEDKPENLPRSVDDVVDQRLPPDHLSERNGGDVFLKEIEEMLSLRKKRKIEIKEFKGLFSIHQKMTTMMIKIKSYLLSKILLQKSSRMKIYSIKEWIKSCLWKILLLKEKMRMRRKIKDCFILLKKIMKRLIKKRRVKKSLNSTWNKI
jgi:hypothetical protein